MRIIAGRFKGRRLVDFKAEHIRPTTDRVKESIFNKLQGFVEGARVLDLFSGTGNLAIESLSRGAQYVEAVETNDKSMQIIRRNLQLLNIEGEINLIKMDVSRYLAKYSGPPFDLILIDPPFTQSISHSTMELLSQSQAIGPGSIVVVESAQKERVDEAYSHLIFLDQKGFGDKKVTFFKVEGNS